jgi:xanthine/CO dehydrogenase XdhC/CoxF family maturation factor
MKETEDIIRAFRLAQQAGKKAALATVVHVEGSSYRRPGARMLVTEDGEFTGAISGGCLEGDALRKALLAISQWQNKLVTYDSMDEEDNTIGIQLGCNGIVHILFEPVDPAVDNHPVALLEKAALQRQASVMVTLFSLDQPSAEQPGTCLLTTTENSYGAIGISSLNTAIQKDVISVFQSRSSIIKQYPLTPGHSLTGFIERIQPAVELVIAGAGNDAFPLVQIAAVLGWHVTIVDGRKTHASSRRFPNVKKIIVAKPAAAVPQIDVDEQTFFVLMSHNYNYDVAMLGQLIGSACRYIGVLGPKKKLEKMLETLEGQGLPVSKTDIEKIHGPVGLDIGAETAEEIALSIVAEIKAVMAQKDAATLRNKSGFIHDHSSRLSPFFNSI